jgi:hypothetical protein
VYDFKSGATFAFILNVIYVQRIGLAYVWQQQNNAS